MRATALKPAQGMGGAGLLALGAGLVALALALLLLRDGGGTPGRSAIVPGAVSSGDTVAFWEARVAADPIDFVALNRLASAYLQRARETGDVGDYGRAQAAVDRSLEELPGDNYTAYALLASLQNVRHDFAGAVETASRAIAIDPADPSAYGALGDAQLALGMDDEAFATYSGLVERAPSLSSFSRMAHIYELRGDLANAEAAWENAISVDSRRSPEATAWSRVQFGNFYLSQGDFSRASAQYAAAAEAFPDYVHGDAGLARLAAAKGDNERAIDLLADVTARQPLPEYVALLGDVYSTAGFPEEAQRQYDLIAAIDQLYIANGINTDLQMAVFLADHDLRPGDALQQALTVHAQQPDSIYAADAVAWALYKAGRPAQALPYAEEALRLGTQDATLYYHAGMVYSALGEMDAAREHLGRALAINPGFSVLQAPIAAQTLAGVPQ